MILLYSVLDMFVLIKRLFDVQIKRSRLLFRLKHLKERTDNLQIRKSDEFLPASF